MKHLFVLTLLITPSLISCVAQDRPAGPTSKVEYQNARQLIRQMEDDAHELIQKRTVLTPEKAEKQLTTALNKKAVITPVSPGVHALSTADIYERVKRSTVIFGSAYNCGKCDRTHVSASSGYIIDEKGICVTNHHVVESYINSSQQNLAMVVRSSAGKIYPVVAILAASEINDLAIVQLDMNGETIPALPQGNPAPVGSEVYVLSHPNNMFYYFSEGIVARNYIQEGRNHDDSKQKYQMAITADYARGSSGGPIVDSYGNLIGTVSSTNSLYYDMEEESKLQMVVKNTIPIIALQQLLSGEDAD